MGSKLKGLLALLLIVLKGTGSTSACSSSCSVFCGCSNRGLSTVPQYLPTHIRELLLQSNAIRTVNQRAFLRYKDLTSIDLSSNRITYIQPGTFSNLLQLKSLYLDNNKITNIQADIVSSPPQLQRLYLRDNQITYIHPGAFSNLPKLRKLYLQENKISNIQPATFSDLPQLNTLFLNNNTIANIHPGTFSNLTQLRWLNLRDNQLVTLSSTIYDELSAISVVFINNNPWKCDCRIVPFRLKMNGFHSFENQITCSQPDNFQGQKLKEINPEDLICEEPTVVSFQRGDDNSLVQELTLHLICQASGIPSPDITVTLPSGVNATVGSGGRVTVEVNGTISTITITNVTASDAGLYTCTAANPRGSTSSTLSVGVHLDVPTTNAMASSLSICTTVTSTHPTSNSYLASSPTVLVHSLPSEEPESDRYFSLSVLIAPIAGAIAGTVLISGIILTMCWKWWTRNRSVGPNPGVIFNNTDTRDTVTTSGHDQIHCTDA
ncbi:leucine-rich repeat-containing protein 4B-like [Branchiostoma lanceolatum]|uniref:leucine-rich repeat-containing protein 4B-like n=1 Tax=Branchiostoma lanceolatum TaxID=7740 RepID=UPI003451A2E4